MGKNNKLSLPSDWYTASISDNLLNRLWHVLRFQELSRIIETARGRVLDIGCADGTFTKIIFDKTRAGKLVGIDNVGNCISYAKRRFARSSRMYFRQAHAEDIPYVDSQFEAIFCLETLQLCKNPEAVISEISRLLIPGGYVIIMNSTKNPLIRMIFTPFGKVSGTNSLSDKQMIPLLTKYGLQMQEKKKLFGWLITSYKARKI